MKKMKARQMMARKKKDIAQSVHHCSKRKRSPQAFYTPFEGLDQHLSREPAQSACDSIAVQTKKVSADVPDDGERLFREAMSGVAPLLRDGVDRVPSSPAPKVPPRFWEQEELEAHTCLVDLVTGDAPFELTYSDEYVDGAVVGLSPKVMKKLRRGELSYQDYIDLHGRNREEARSLVISFLRRSVASKYRCVLIVSGRGLNSRDKQPVLKESLVQWLIRAPLKRLVLAFASARSYDGGAGAFYVLLRRGEKKNPPLVTPAR
jgi:DNA-nicking Smr family endonuclease